MKRFSNSILALVFAVTIGFFGAGCSDESNSVSSVENLATIPVKFISPSADEISGENALEVVVANVETGQTYRLNLNSPAPIVFPERTFYVFSGNLEVPTGDIGEKMTYQLKATYLGLGDGPNVPSRDVSHMVTIDGVTPFYGDDQGMYFSATCDGRIEMTPVSDPNSPILASSRPYFDVSQFWQGQFSGNTIKVVVEELTASSGGGSTWRPVFTSYDWTTHGILPTYRFTKAVTYEIGWNTIAQLRPTTGEKFIRAKATIDYFGQSQVVTDQVSLNGSGTEWTSANADGYRVFRLTGGYGGKG